MTDRLERLERHLSEVLAGPRRLMRSLSKHTTGTDAMTRKTKATGHVCQRIEGRQYRISWINPNGKSVSKMTDAAGAVRFCERHNVTIFPPAGETP